MNQLINVAVAEKISALRTEQYFRERSLRANRAETMQILAGAGLENEPAADDELPGAAIGARKTRKKPAANRKHRQRTNSRTKKVRG